MVARVGRRNEGIVRRVEMEREWEKIPKSGCMREVDTGRRDIYTSVIVCLDRGCGSVHVRRGNETSFLSAPTQGLTRLGVCLACILQEGYRVNGALNRADLLVTMTENCHRRADTIHRQALQHVAWFCGSRYCNIS